MAKKNFGAVVQESVAEPVKEHKAAMPVIVKKQPKFKIVLNDENASKRTYYIREDVGQMFDRACFEGNIDKGALINVIMKEWLEKNQGRTQFDMI